MLPDEALKILCKEYSNLSNIRDEISFQMDDIKAILEYNRIYDPISFLLNQEENDEHKDEEKNNA